MFGMPAPTQFDLNFRLLEIPVRVSPWFWLTALILGDHDDPRMLPLWIGAVFISILVHEYGHGLMARAFGFDAQIALFGMGGLCASEAERQTPNQRLAVLFAGPLAQFLLLALIIVIGNATMGIGLEEAGELARRFLGLPPGNDVAALRLGGALLGSSELAANLYWMLFFINLMWPLLNLLPIWPLDGGQITGELLAKVNRHDGRRWGHIISMITAALLAFYLLYKRQGDLSGLGLLQILFFASFAFVNYQILQAYHQRFLARGPDEDPDWWTRS
jgi:Zn-dependent protease